MIRTYDVPPRLCPACGSLAEAATSVTGVTMPGPGDFTICWKCGSVLRFQTDMSLAGMTREDWADIDFDIADLLLRLQKEVLGVAKRHFQVEQRRN